MARRWEIEEAITLAGGFVASLKPCERNAWSEYLKGRPEWAAWKAAAIDMNALNAVVSGGEVQREGEYRRAMEECERATDAMWEVGRAWYAELVAKDKPADPGSVRDAVNEAVGG